MKEELTMGRITRNTLRRSYYTQIGDVCFVGSLDYWDPRAIATLNLQWKNWMVEILPRKRQLTEAGNLPIIGALASEYENFRREHHKDPDWIEKLPLQNREYLRNSHFFQGEEFEPWVVVPSLPFAGYGYQILEGGLIERVEREWQTFRLSGVNQLGFLHYPIITDDEPLMVTSDFPHNRRVHQFDVGNNCVLILFNNNRSQVELDLVRAAATTHDVLTPGGGDTTKLIDRKAFDEDLHYPEALQGVDWSQFPELPENAPELLPQIILNRGLLGQVLDIADKIAYVGRDLYQYYIVGPKLPGHGEIAALLHEHQQPCSIWECARIKNDQLYFDDKDRLVNFLMIRATLFAQVYNNPSSRFWENFVKTFLQNRFYRTGRITRQWLLQAQDIHLENLINQEIGQNFVGLWVGMKQERMETFPSLGLAIRRKKQLRRKGRPVVMIEKTFTPKAGLHFLVKTQEGLQSLSKADPENARRIRRTIRPNYEYSLHYLDIPRNKLPNALQSDENWD
jgi:hypothetical protein